MNNIERDSLFDIIIESIETNFEDCGTNAAIFTLITQNGKYSLLEWVNNDNLSERIDSHLLINECEKLEAAFNNITEYKGSYHAEYTYYIDEIFDLLDTKIAEIITEAHDE